MDRKRATSIATLVALGVILLFFWDAPAVWPLKILVVLFHELGHAAAALITGGSVVSIGLEPNQGGVTYTRGGNAFLVLNAGYLGSLLAGAVLLFASRRAKSARWGVRALGAVLGLATLLWIRPLWSFGFAFAVLTTLAVLALSRWASDFVAQLALRVVGVFSVLYALWDVRSDVLSGRDVAVSDATMLAELTWIPAPVWGVAWLAAGLAILWVSRRWLVA